MKLRHPWLIASAAFLMTLVGRAWMRTLRYAYHGVGSNLDPRDPALRERYLYAFWHEAMLLPAFHYAPRGARIVISNSKDGELIASVCRRLGYLPTRGSTRRGAVQAVRELLRVAAEAHTAVTPDGPRGPRRVAQLGIVYLAARTGQGMVAAGFGVRRAWRLGSWDRFCVPRPFTFAVLVTMPPIFVPADLDRDGLEAYRLRLQAAMDEATRLAEEYAETGIPPQALPEGGSLRGVAAP